MNSEDGYSCTNEVTHSSVSEQIKKATESILRQADEICSLSVNQKESETLGNGGAIGSGRRNTSVSPVDNH